MRIALADDPAVISMAARLSINEFEVVGMLHHLWGWADTQSRDGHAPGVTNVWIDRYVRHAGFAEVMIAVGWLEIDETGVTFPKFDRHNGETAKTRALAAERKRNQRNKVTEEEGQMSRSQRDTSVTREEKRRDLKEDTESDDPGDSPSSSKDPKATIWKLGVKLLGDFGESEKTARGFLGRFAKLDESKLAEVIGYLAANPKIEPKAYIAAAFTPKKLEVVL